MPRLPNRICTTGAACAERNKERTPSGFYGDPLIILIEETHETRGNHLPRWSIITESNRVRLTTKQPLCH